MKRNTNGEGGHLKLLLENGIITHFQRVVSLIQFLVNQQSKMNQSKQQRSAPWQKCGKKKYLSAFVRSVFPLKKWVELGTACHVSPQREGDQPRHFLNSTKRAFICKTNPLELVHQPPTTNQSVWPLPFLGLPLPFSCRRCAMFL